MLLQVLFLKDLSFAICEKMAPISSWEPKQFSFNSKGKIPWEKKKKNLFQKCSSYSTLPKYICGFFRHTPEDSSDCGSSELLPACISSFLIGGLMQGCPELGGEHGLLIVFCEVLIFMSKKENKHWW